MNNDNIDPQLQLPSNTTDNDNVSAATKSLGEISFVDWGQEHPKKKPRARLYHRKSRNGCTNCKSRKVKVSMSVVSYSSALLILGELLPISSAVILTISRVLSARGFPCIHLSFIG